MRTISLLTALLVGCPGDIVTDTNGDPPSGLVRVEPILGPGDDESFGAYVAPAGDVNADGLEDFLVGHLYNPDASGDAWLHWGDASGSYSSLTLAGDDESFGATLAGLGDTNNDGYADFAVGAWADAVIHVYNGPSDGVSDPVVLSDDGGSSLGYAIAGPRRFDGDAYADLATYDTHSTSGAIIWICPGSPESVQSDCTQIRPNSAVQRLVAVGDVNGDGMRDLAYIDDDDDLYLLPGQTLVASELEATLLAFAGAHQAVPMDIAAAGDFDGDGLDDLAALSIDESGKLALHRATGQEDLEDITFLELSSWSGVASDAYHARVTNAGDVDEDGTPDLAVSLVGASLEQGWVRVIDDQGLLIYQLDTVERPEDGRMVGSSSLGWSLAGAGDVNGDSVPDLLVGSLMGAAYVVSYEISAR